MQARRLLALAILLPSLAWPQAHGPRTRTVTIESMKFSPATITVHKGDKVTWQNKDLVPHTASAAGHFESHEIGAGMAWTWTAGAPGRYDYVCSLHFGMKGTVIVQ